MALSDAKLKNMKAKALLEKDIDPKEEKDKLKAALIEQQEEAQQARAVLSFAQVFSQWYELRKGEWTIAHGHDIHQRITKHILPELGDKAIDAIKPKDVIAMLKKVEALGALDTAKRLFQYTRSIFRYAVNMSHCENNPCGSIELKEVLKKTTIEHYKTITDPAEIGQRIVPHGFRHMASTRLNEMKYNADAIERQLAHADTNKVRASYNHSEHLDERIKMMQDWADYLDGLRDGR